MKCKDCKACIKGFFKTHPDKYVCTGTKEPFVINNINSYCIEYSNKKEPDCWSWSWNKLDDGRDWFHGTFDSKEEAIEDALGYFEDMELPHIYIVRCELVPLNTYVNAESIMEDLDEQYRDETGCDYYIYENVTDEQTKWLGDKLSDLMNEFHEKIGLKPCWFKVVEYEEIDLNEYKKEK